MALAQLPKLTRTLLCACAGNTVSTGCTGICASFQGRGEKLYFMCRYQTVFSSCQCRDKRSDLPVVCQNLASCQQPLPSLPDQALERIAHNLTPQSTASLLATCRHMQRLMSREGWVWALDKPMYVLLPLLNMEHVSLQAVAGELGVMLFSLGCSWYDSISGQNLSIKCLWLLPCRGVWPC